jgi:hypothetical protein
MRRVRQHFSWWIISWVCLFLLCLSVERGVCHQHSSWDLFFCMCCELEKQCCSTAVYILTASLFFDCIIRVNMDAITFFSLRKRNAFFIQKFIQFFDKILL